LQFEATTSQRFADRASADREPLFDLTPAGHLLLPVAVFVVTLLTIAFARYSDFSPTLWPTNAIILAALLRCRRSRSHYGSILLGGGIAVALANMAGGQDPAVAVILSLTDVLEALLTLGLLTALKVDVSNLTCFKGLLIFIAVAGGIAPLPTAIVTAMTLGSAHSEPWSTLWLQCYPAHALGMIIVTPFLISITSSDWKRLHFHERYREALLIFMSVIAITVCGSYFRPFVFLIAPAILLATLRFGLIGATMATLLVALISSAFVVFEIGRPVLTQVELSERVLAFQILMAVTSLWSLPIAALLAERDRLLNDLSLANAQLKIESERQSNMVTGLHRHLSIVEEKERLRLSYELHDQAGQDVVGAILELSAIDPLTQGVARQRLQQVRKRMEDMGKTLHRIAWELRPPSIDELGLQKAVASHIDDWGEQCGTEVDFHCDDPNLDEVPSEIGSAVYRIVQEALTNVVKHARQPSTVSVVIRRDSDTLQVIVEDNGCGFDLNAVAAKTGAYGGLGLDGMRERLLLIGGTLEIESAMGAGTTIFARIPLDSRRPAA